MGEDLRSICATGLLAGEDHLGRHDVALAAAPPRAIPAPLALPVGRRNSLPMGDFQPNNAAVMGGPSMRCPMRSHLPDGRVLIIAALMLLGAPAANGQMVVAVDGFVIFDNGIGDLDATIDEIEFDSLAPPPDGFTTNSGFDAKGRVETSNVAGALAGQLNTGQALVLTDFVADRPLTALPGAFNIILQHDFGPPIPGGGTAADIVVAFANDGTAEPPYQSGGGAIPLAAGEDTIDSWQGFVDGVPIPNPTLPLPPLPNVAGLNTPYQTHGHATINPLFGGLVFDPTLRGELTFSLGGTRNQFILLTSAEVGLEDLGPPPVPALSQPGLLVLIGLLAAASFGVLGQRKSRTP